MKSDIYYRQEVNLELQMTSTIGLQFRSVARFLYSPTLSAMAVRQSIIAIVTLQIKSIVASSIVDNITYCAMACV